MRRECTGAKEDPWIIADCLPDVNLRRAGKLQADVAKQQGRAEPKWDGAGDEIRPRLAIFYVEP